VETDLISPLAGGELFIQLTADEDSRLAVLNARKEEVASIDAEGTGTFTKLIISEAAKEESPNPFPSDPASPAGGSEEAASIGSATITAGRLQALITTEAVTDQSKVFITPTSSTSGQVPYVSRKVSEEYFIVRLDQALPDDVEFDWWIVN